MPALYHDWLSVYSSPVFIRVEGKGKGMTRKWIVENTVIAFSQNSRNKLCDKKTFLSKQETCMIAQDYRSSGPWVTETALSTEQYSSTMLEKAWKRIRTIKLSDFQDTNLAWLLLQLSDIFIWRKPHSHGVQNIGCWSS